MGRGKGRDTKQEGNREQWLSRVFGGFHRGWGDNDERSWLLW